MLRRQYMMVGVAAAGTLPLVMIAMNRGTVPHARKMSTTADGDKSPEMMNNTLKTRESLKGKANHHSFYVHQKLEEPKNS